MKLFDPITAGDLALPHRVVMAPLTRNRAAQPGDVPHELNATYYAQRASAALIISEATQVDPLGKGYVATPGIYSDEQVAGWRLVTDAVHEAGGRIVLQLWHVGRISHVDLLPEGEQPVAPSAIRATSQTVVSAESGMVDVSAPRALRTDEIPGIVAQFRRGAENAKAAGFDGVEIHGANGYLIDQFTRDGTNQRDDQYGGSLENRVRVPLEIARAVVDGWGAGRVGYRISPAGAFNDMSDSDPIATFGALARGLGGLGLAFLHNVEAFAGGQRDEAQIDAIKSAFQDAGGGAYMANGGYQRDDAEARLEAGKADLVSFGETFLANPDLPERFRQGAPLNEGDRATYYGGDDRGYTDYPTLAEVPV
ncbi:MAG: alkene reductase [Planctomycetota bacterium]